MIDAIVYRMIRVPYYSIYFFFVGNKIRLLKIVRLAIANIHTLDFIILLLLSWSRYKMTTTSFVL